MAAEEHPKLKQQLHGIQIFFIVLSGIIGGGIFNQMAEALEIAGPAGAIVTMIVMGLITICLGETISEFTQIFPAPNAIVEYVHAFVDEDLAWVVGLALWYLWASVFAIQNFSAANLSRYWGITQFWQTLGFYVVAPAIILAINFVGVWLFGVIETIGGSLKVCLVFGTAILLFVLGAKNGFGGKDGPINDGFKANGRFIRSTAEAVFYAIPLIAYMDIGVEIVAVTAFEAKTSRSLRLPSQTIAYVVFFLYFLCTIGETLNVEWTNSHLPFIYGGVGNDTASSQPLKDPTSSSLPVIAAWKAGYPKLGGFLNGAMIFSVLSASNTSLYVASRTLYGLTRKLPEANRVGRTLKNLSIVVPQTGVPAPALVVSAISFFWLPFLQLKRGYAIQELITIIGVSASVSGLIVWAAVSLAFIRYEYWLRICGDEIKERYPEFRRNTKQYKPFTLLAWAQPIPAYISFIGCILAFAFASATWWETPVTFTKVAVAYAAHIILFILWVVFKTINGRWRKRWWVPLDQDVTVLVAKLRALQWLKDDETPPPPPYRSGSELREVRPRPEDDDRIERSQDEIEPNQI